MISVDPAWQLTLRVALAALLASAARHKLRDRTAFAAIVAAYRLLPTRWAGATAATLPWLEVALACALLYPPRAHAATVGAAAILATYSVAIACNIARGRVDIDCGCGLAGSKQRLSTRLLARNAALIGCALLAALPASARTLEWTDAVTVVGTVSTAVLLWSAAAHAVTWNRAPGGTGGSS